MKKNVPYVLGNVLYALENVLCAPRKNMYSAVVGWSVNRCLLGLFYSVVQVFFFLVVLCLVVPSIIESMVLNSPTIIVRLCLPSVLSVLLHVFGALLSGTYVFIISSLTALPIKKSVSWYFL